VCFKWSSECVQVYSCDCIHSSFKGPFESVITSTKTPSCWHELCAETCWRTDNALRIRLLHVKLVLKTKCLTSVWGHPRSNADRNTDYPQKDFSGFFSVTQSRIFIILNSLLINQPMPEAARSKAYVCCRSLPGIVGSNSAGGTAVCVLWMLCGDR